MPLWSPPILPDRTILDALRSVQRLHIDADRLIEYHEHITYEQHTHGL